jgi:hypothetical protein
VTDLIALNGRLLASIKADDYAGHDPFDFLNSRLFQATPLNQNRIARLVWLQLGKHLPINLRPLLQVPKMRNPKGIALCLAGLLQDFRRTSRPEFLDEAKRLGPWLISQRSDPEFWQSPCWGYHFDWQARAFHVPAGKPNIITTCYVARALYALGQQTADSRLMELALSSARFMADHLYTERDGQAFYAYIPGETAFVHNASLWGAAWCAFAGHQTGRVDLVERRLEVIMRGGGGGLLERVLIIDPARVDRVHEHATARELLGARARHHVEGRLGHVRVRMVGRLIPD